MKKCTNCGAEMNDDDIFCMNCGAKNDKPALEKYPGDNGPTGLDQYHPNKSAIRKYFLGYGILPTILIVVGVVLTIFVWFIGIPLIGVGIYLKIRSDTAGEQLVDQSERQLINILKDNYHDKINMDESEVNLIDPVYFVGFGDEPHSSLSLTENDLSNATGDKWKLFKGLFNSVKSVADSNDPIVSYKLGSDGYPRSLLLQVTTYVFSENQMFIYTANADISTGIIYDEYTNEIFYKDISGIFLEESLAKAIDPKKKTFKYYKTNRICLIGNNYRLNSSMRVNVSGAAFSSQFGAMRSLIREKKNS